MTKSGETLEAVSGGLADTAFVPEGFYESQFYPLFVAMLPYSTTSEWVANKALKEMFDTYAWSILSSPFPAEFGWTSAQLGLNFTIVMSCFCIGGLSGSFVTRRLSARVTVLIGAAMCSFWGIFFVPVSRRTACGFCTFPTAV